MINRYDEYGIPGGNGRRFQYTGQAWLSEVGLYYYKNRVYSPTLGRFLQPDPIGYDDSPNLYAYVLNDPVNFVDPLGLQIVVTQCKIGSINIGGEGISRVCVKIDYTPGGGIARAGPGGRSPRGGDGGGGGERPTALRKERLSDKVTDALCEAIGEGNIIPLELITAVAGAAAGVLTDKVVGSSTSEALRRHELRRPVVGSKFLPTEARVAIRGMRAGIIGAAAGLAVGYFFGEEIEEAISDAVASCKKAL